ncbi:MAG TPA: hypothetical protein VH309_14400 [Elusimicrobiota bacterium]|jgi:hypothetical protein|nr:hypothetical protein [Elusimicrobiota bacterium]
MTPTPKAARSSVNWLALGAALLLAPAARAQSLAPDLSSSLSDLNAKAAQGVSAQKAMAENHAQELADGWGATANVPMVILAQRVAPDSSYTPGHLCSPSDPNFKEYRYAERIPYCNRNVTSQMKTTVAAHYGVPQSDWSGYEFDHLIPLAIGGDSSIDNVWPQPHGDPDGSNGKDKLEDLLYREMAAGTVTQAEAVQQIYGWFTGSSMAAQAVQISAR